MKSTIFIPDKIKVGFQNRSDTYTGKLGYVIYFDEKGKLRKENSWQSWRDGSIEPLELDNIPMEGFVLNKKVGDYNSGWGNHRMAYTRVYHPNGGWEFEITIENLLYILENCTSTKGKGLEGELILGWDGKDLLLIPVDSPDYKSIQEYSQKVGARFKLGARTVKVGATYLTKNNETYVYMGRFHSHEYTWRKEIDLPNGEQFSSYSKSAKTKFFFVQIKTDGSYDLVIETGNWQKFIAEVDENSHEDYADMYDFMENQRSFSPVNIPATTYTDFTFDEFKEYVEKELHSGSPERYYHWRDARFNSEETGTLQQIKIKSERDENGNSLNYYTDIDITIEETLKPTWSWQPQTRTIRITERVKFNSLEEVFNIFKPKYQTLYLENGKLYSEEK